MIFNGYATLLQSCEVVGRHFRPFSEIVRSPDQAKISNIIDLTGRQAQFCAERTLRIDVIGMGFVSFETHVKRTRSERLHVQKV